MQNTILRSLLCLLIFITSIPDTKAADTPDSYGHVKVALIGGYGIGLAWYCSSASTSATFTYQGDNTWTLNNFNLPTPTGSADWENALYIGYNNGSNDTDLKFTGSTFVVGEYMDFNTWGNTLTITSADAGTYNITITFTSAGTGTILFSKTTGSSTDPDPGTDPEPGTDPDPEVDTGTLSATLPEALAEYGINGGAYIPEEDLTMWYTSGEGFSASDYKAVGNSLLLGNGALGGMLAIDGATHKLYISEKELFTADASDHALQSFGTVTMTPGWGKEATSNIVHQLDLAKGVYSFIGKRSDNVVEAVEWIASYPDQVLAGVISASESGKLDYDFTLTSYNTLGASVTASLGSGYAEAKFSGSLSGSILSYALCMRVVPVGGSLTLSGTTIKVTNADKIMIYISGLTDYDSSVESLLSGTSSLAATVDTYVANAASSGWDTLYATHTADHSALFGRMSLNIGGQTNDTTTQQMLTGYASASAGQQRMLENLVFALGRYMEIASSRPRADGKGVDCPSNLQGIWNDGYAMWKGDIHGNINVNMNYWPAEITNLSETHLGLCNWVMNLSTHSLWQNRAKAYTQGNSSESITDGWTCYMASSPFGSGYNYMTQNNNAVQAWYCHHLIQHYLFTMDDTYRTAMMPVLWDAARFWLQYLIKTTDGESYIYETQAEDSPEQGATGVGTPHTQQLVYYLFDNLVKLARRHGIPAGATAAEWTAIQDVYEHLDDGMHTYSQDGSPCLREDKTSDSRFGEQNHRHLSHLVCVYPLGQVHPGDEMWDAARNTMIDRGAVGYGNTDLAVWTLGWKACNWARARDQRAFSNYIYAFTKANGNNGGLYNNLYSNNQTTQIDGNFGLTAAVAEMLVQSDRSDVVGDSPYCYVDIAPALPAEWTEGDVSGLKAQGNFEAGFTWSGGKVTEIRVKALAASPVPLYIHYDGLTEATYYVAEILGMTRDTGETIDKWDAAHVWKFVPSSAGSYVVIRLGDDEDVEPETVQTILTYDIDGTDNATVTPPSPNTAGIQTLTSGTDTLLSVMFGTSGAKYLGATSFVDGGVSWAAQDPDADFSVSPDVLTGYAAPSPYKAGASAAPYTEVNGMMGAENTEEGGLFLTPVSGDFLRIEPRYSGIVDLWLKQTSPLYILDETGRVIEATTCEGATRQTSIDGSASGAYTVTGANTKVKYTIPVKGGKTYFIGSRDDSMGFVAIGFTKASYSPASYTIATTGTVASQSWPTEGETATIRLNRTFTAGYCHPIVLPFSVSESLMREIFGDEVKVIYLDPIDNSSASDPFRSVFAPAIRNSSLTLTVHYYQMLYANVPAFIIPSRSVVEPIFSHVTFQGSEIASYPLDADRRFWVTGNYTSTLSEANGEMYYIDNAVDGVTVCHSNIGVDMRPTRAWIEVRGSAAGAPTLHSVNSRTFTADDQMQASISAIIADDATTPTDNTLYNVLGIPVDPTTPLAPGIYVSRGRKILRK